MRSIHALALASILAPLVWAELPPSAAAAATAAVHAAAAAEHVPPLAERDNSGDLTSGVRGVPGAAKWMSIGPTKSAMTAVAGDGDEGKGISPGQERPAAASTGDVGTNVTLLQPFPQKQSVLPMLSEMEKKHGKGKGGQNDIQEKEEKEFLDVIKKEGLFFPYKEYVH